MGPVTGRLLAEMMTGEAPFTDPAPYRAERFWLTAIGPVGPLQVALQDRADAQGAAGAAGPGAAAVEAGLDELLALRLPAEQHAAGQGEQARPPSAAAGS